MQKATATLKGNRRRLRGVSTDESGSVKSLVSCLVAPYVTLVDDSLNFCPKTRPHYTLKKHEQTSLCMMV